LYFSYKILVGKPAGKRPFGRPSHRWENNVKVGHRKIDSENVDQIHPA
jgi:hypothetical protein